VIRFLEFFLQKSEIFHDCSTIPNVSLTHSFLLSWILFSLQILNDILTLRHKFVAKFLNYFRILITQGIFIDSNGRFIWKFSQNLTKICIWNKINFIISKLCQDICYSVVISTKSSLLISDIK
jgi:hypothetical protein